MSLSTQIEVKTIHGMSLFDCYEVTLSTGGGSAAVRARPKGPQEINRASDGLKAAAP